MKGVKNNGIIRIIINRIAYISNSFSIYYLRRRCCVYYSIWRCDCMRTYNNMDYEEDP